MPLVRPPERNCDLCDRQRAAAVSRSWQTHVWPLLDAVAAYLHPTQRAAWAIGSITVVYSRSCLFIDENRESRVSY
ncbi:hypothetical protein B296_00026855 [Ensete ventricosum]|uniref:Uncharacterized protein n=1 Tax=Ensete ventricosum TaxID=4639 RepID=A0A426XC40_ENSVE|nr:hypothetical protein B296_00026855 [Ensete ventricosum]